MKRTIFLMATAGIAVAGGAVLAQQAIAPVPDTETAAPSTTPAGEWRAFGRTAYGDRFSPLSQITPDNVDKLKLAWTYRTGDVRKPGEGKSAYAFEATPIMAAGSVAFCTPHGVVIAIDPETGKERWRFDPNANTKGVDHYACRGVSYYEAPANTPECAKRILSPTLDGRLIALDATNGHLCRSFGVNGMVNLLDGLGHVGPGYAYTTSPPVIIGRNAVLGGWVYDNQYNDEPSGVVRAYDAVTGKFAWAWDAGKPGDHGPPPPGKTFTRDTPNAWTVFSADPQLGLVYVPTGNAPPDFYGPNRTAAQDEYNSSIVALDAKTGDVRWHFQTTHHDVWDFDIGSQPVLVDVPGQYGVVSKALLAPTKRGEIFMLDRTNGRPLAAVEERPVPQNGAPGERLSPTQPFSVGLPSMAPSRLTEKNMWGATPLDQLWCRIQYHRYRYDGQFTPPTVQGSITYPGSFGVIDWGSVSVDPVRSLMIVNSSWMPYIDQLIPRKKADQRDILPHGSGKESSKVNTGLAASGGTPYASYVRPFLSFLGFPCHGPPWGHLTAVDLKTHKIAWRKRFGTTGGVAPLGIALPTGIFSLGGSMVTQSGLTFIGAAVDGKFRAFNTATGKMLWSTDLPAGGQAGPMTYISPKSGRQFVVIAAGGHSALKTKAGDYVVAYALPR